MMRYAPALLLLLVGFYVGMKKPQLFAAVPVVGGFLSP